MLCWSNESSAPRPEFASAARTRARRYPCSLRKSTRSSKSTCVRPGACSGRSQRCAGSTSSGRTIFGSGCRLLLVMGNSSSGQFYNELAGDKLDPSPDARRSFAVAGVLGTLRLHAEPGEERPAPALCRGDLDRLGDAGGTDPTRLELHAQPDQTRERIVACGMLRPARQVLGISGLLAARLASQSLERRAAIQLQASGAHRATRQLGPGKQIAAAGARQLRLGAQELGLRGARIAREVIALERFEGLPRIRLPIGRQRAAGTAGALAPVARGASRQLDLGAALERPPAIDLVDQAADLAQAGVDLRAQRPKVLGGGLGVRPHLLRIGKHLICLLQGVAQIAKNAVRLGERALRR